MFVSPSESCRILLPIKSLHHFQSDRLALAALKGPTALSNRLKRLPEQSIGIIRPVDLTKATPVSPVRLPVLPGPMSTQGLANPVPNPKCPADNTRQLPAAVS